MNNMNINPLPLTAMLPSKISAQCYRSAMWALCNSDGVYRWPEIDVDYWAIMEGLLKAGAPIERDMLSWLEQESDIPFPTKERLDALFRQYGASA
jgi:hypothetical protein